MREKHGGALLVQALEAKRLIGSIMSVVTEAGENCVHLVFFNDTGEFDLIDDGPETKLILSRPLALSLVALLRVALAQFPVLHGRSEPWENMATTRRLDVRVEPSRHTLSVVWPSVIEGVQRQNATGQVELRLGGAGA